MKIKIICIILLAIMIVSYTEESKVTTDSFNIGKDSKITVTIRNSENTITTSLTILNISKKLIVINNDYFKRNFFASQFEYKDGEIVPSHTKDYIRYSFVTTQDSLLFLKPNESANYTHTYEYYYDKMGRLIVADDVKEWIIDKEKQIYCVVEYHISDIYLQGMEALTDEYLLEAFRKRYLLLLP